MEMQPLDRVVDPTTAEMPDDAAMLYSWANLRGAKYGDLSTSQRVYRGQIRRRAAVQLRQSELMARTQAAVRRADADAANGRLSRNWIDGPTTDAAIEDAAEIERLRRVSPWETAQRARRAAAAQRLEAERKVFTAKEPNESVPPGEVSSRVEVVQRIAGGQAESCEASWESVEFIPEFSRLPVRLRNPSGVTSGSVAPQSNNGDPLRWFALKGLFSRKQRDSSCGVEPSSDAKVQPPILVLLSLAGGVGKTTLAATLGRALCAMGERVLLAETTAHSRLPFYFGASQIRPGVMRTFLPPSGSTDAPVRIVSCDLADVHKPHGKDEETIRGEAVERLVGHSQLASRVLIDLDAGSGWLIERLAGLKPTVLVPLMPDMSSLFSIEAIEESFRTMHDAHGHTMQPLYLLHQFDAALPLQLAIREVLRERLGERLLPLAIHRSATLSEALAEGMTILDYEPESAAAREYEAVANWLRNAAAPATTGLQGLRWRER